MLNSFVLIQCLALCVGSIQFVQANAQAVTVTGIQFRGNKVFSDDQLLSAMRLTNRSNLNGSSVDSDELKKGAARTREFMAAQGYLGSRVDDPRFERSDEGLVVIMAINEGPRFRVGRVRFENATFFSQDQLLQIFGIKEGEIAASFRAKSQAAFERLKRIYSNYGYLNWTIIPKIDMNDDEGVIDCTFRIEEGTVFSIGRVTFTGGTKENEQILRPQVLIREGQVFNWQLLDESLALLQRRGFSKKIQPSDVEIQPDESTHLVDVTINLK